MKKTLLFALIAVMISIVPAYAQLRANVSPVTVELNDELYTTGGASEEIVFPYKTRDLYIRNNDSTCGIWVNLVGGDLDSQDSYGNRVYIAPADNLDLIDYGTDAITVFYDGFYTARTKASPITVLSVF